jgi:hypothetical protein
MVFKKHRIGAVVCCCAVTGAGAGKAMAQVPIFNSNGFETAAGYVDGDYLAGQPSTGPQFVSTSFYPSPYAQVTDYTAVFGSNSNASNLNVVELANPASSTTPTTTYTYPVLSSIMPGSGGIPSQISTTFQEAIGQYFVGNVATPYPNNTFFGVVALDGTDTNPVGELGINATTGMIEGATTLTAAGTTFQATPDTFYDFDLLLDYGTQTYSLYEAAVNAATYTLLGTSNFLTATNTYGTTALVSSPTTALPVSEAAYVDNFAITAVPEPGTASLVMGGAAITLLKRRRRPL